MSATRREIIACAGLRWGSCAYLLLGLLYDSDSGLVAVSDVLGVGESVGQCNGEVIKRIKDKTACQTPRSVLGTLVVPHAKRGKPHADPLPLLSYNFSERTPITAKDPLIMKYSFRDSLLTFNTIISITSTSDTHLYACHFALSCKAIACHDASDPLRLIKL